MYRDPEKSLKRRLSRSRSRSGTPGYHSEKWKVEEEVLIPNDLVGHLMAENLKLLEKLRRECNPVTIWVKARSKASKRNDRMRTMLLKGDSTTDLEDTRVKIHDFFHRRLGITVDGVVPALDVTSSMSSSSNNNSNQEDKALELPFPIPTVSRSPKKEVTETPSLYQENFSAPELAIFDGIIPIFMETNEEFQKVIDWVRSVIKMKFPDTEISVLPAADHDNPDLTKGPAHIIFIRAPSQLSVEVARMVILQEFKNKLGVRLEEQSPELKQLQEKLDKSQELVRKHQKEINNLKSFNDELELNRAYYKDKYNRKIKNDNLNEKEFQKMKMKLRSSANDYEIAVKEKEKLTKQVIDLQTQLEENAELLKIIKSCKNDENPEEDQTKEICLRCPQLLLDIRNLKEQLSLSAGLISLREQELKLLKNQKISSNEEESSPCTD